MKWKIRGVGTAWAVIYPDGRVLADSAFATEADAWRVGLGWPDQADIEAAKKKGYRVCQVTIIAPPKERA